MFRTMSVRSKMLISVVGILVVTLLVTGLLTTRLVHRALSDRLEQYELVRTVEAIRNGLDTAVSVPMAQTRQMAGDVFLLDWTAVATPKG